MMKYFFTFVLFDVYFSSTESALHKNVQMSTGPTEATMSYEIWHKLFTMQELLNKIQKFKIMVI